MNMKLFSNYFNAGKEQRFASQIRPHLQNLYRQAYRLTNHQDNAEDLVQDLLLRLYEKDIDFSEIQNLPGWLLRSLYNQFIDNTRKKNRSPVDLREMDSDNLLASQGDDSSSPHTIFHQELTEKTVLQAMLKLNPDQQALMALHDIEGHTLTELSDILDTPTGTLKSRLHRARKIVRNELLMEPFTENKRFTG